MVDHIIYKTVKYVGILYPVLNQEPQQHINLPRLWGNHSLVSYEASQLSQSPYDCFCNKYHFSPPFLQLPKEIISGKCLRKKKMESPGNCSETETQQEIGSKTLQTKSGVLFKMLL